MTPRSHNNIGAKWPELNSAKNEANAIVSSVT